MSRSPLWLALGWLAHPIWDVVLHLMGAGTSFTPAWYALACLGFDPLVAVYVWVERESL